MGEPYDLPTPWGVIGTGIGAILGYREAGWMGAAAGSVLGGLAGGVVTLASEVVTAKKEDAKVADIADRLDEMYGGK